MNQSELPPLPPWYRRWISALWRLFPCTIQWSITGTILVGLLVLLVQWGGDVETGMLAGLIFGAALGLYFDIRSAMDGETIDD
ncbi:MAG: hypothetical protein JNJ77_13225 [Planctomycetia bacterium]|nr:hypothetical protein [Planctomycetia bacterium]